MFAGTLTGFNSQSGRITGDYALTLISWIGKKVWRYPLQYVTATASEVRILRRQRNVFPSVPCHWWYLGERKKLKNTWSIENRCHVSPKVFYQDKWRKKTNGEPAVPGSPQEETAVKMHAGSTYLRIFMAALCNREGHYIFALWFLLLSIYPSFFRHLISAVADWMSAILPHMVWP